MESNQILQLTKQCIASVNGFTYVDDYVTKIGERI